MKNNQNLCKYAIWRSAYFPRDSIFPYIKTFDNNWIQSLTYILKITEYLEYLQSVDNSKNKEKYTNLIKKLKLFGWNPTDSKIIDNLRFCKKIFLSSIFKNDTGSSGIVYLVPLDPLTRKSELSDGIFSLGKNENFHFKYSTAPIINLNNDQIYKIEKHTNAITKYLIEKSDSKGVFNFSVDYLISGTTVQLLEIHYPSRGFEILYAPFRDQSFKFEFPLDIYSKELSNFISENDVKKIILVFVDTYEDSEVRRISSIFRYEFENLFQQLSKRHTTAIDISARTLSDMYKNKNNYKNLEMEKTMLIYDDLSIDQKIIQNENYRDSYFSIIPDEIVLKMANDRFFIKNLCIDLDISTPYWIELKEDQKFNINEIINKLGKFVILKERYHLPSWHPEKKHVEILDLTDPKDIRKMQLRINSSNILIERLISSSIDQNGHCGELRIHYCETKV